MEQLNLALGWAAMESAAINALPAAAGQACLRIRLPPLRLLPLVRPQVELPPVPPQWEVRRHQLLGQLPRAKRWWQLFPSQTTNTAVNVAFTNGSEPLTALDICFTFDGRILGSGQQRSKFFEDHLTHSFVVPVRDLRWTLLAILFIVRWHPTVTGLSANIWVPDVRCSACFPWCSATRRSLFLWLAHSGPSPLAPVEDAVAFLFISPLLWYCTCTCLTLDGFKVLRLMMLGD